MYSPDARDFRLQGIWDRLVAARRDVRGRASLDSTPSEGTQFLDGYVRLSTRLDGLDDSALAFAAAMAVNLDFLKLLGGEVQSRGEKRVDRFADSFFEKKYDGLLETARMGAVAAKFGVGLVGDVVLGMVAAAGQVVDREREAIEDSISWLVEAGFEAEGSVRYYEFWSRQPERKYLNDPSLVRRAVMTFKDEGKFLDDFERMDFCRQVIAARG